MTDTAFIKAVRELRDKEGFTSASRQGAATHLAYYEALRDDGFEDEFIYRIMADAADRVEDWLQTVAPETEEERAARIAWVNQYLGERGVSA